MLVCFTCYMVGLQQTVELVSQHVLDKLPGAPVGLYLIGSTVLGGAKPDSDIDFLLLTTASLSQSERGELVQLLLPISGWKGHRSKHPEAAGRRPIELTSLVLGEPRPVPVTTVRDFQYGEWLRDSLISGKLPQPVNDLDILPLVATALTANRPLLGPPLDTVLVTVHPLELRQALKTLAPAVVAGIDGDERNAVLTLARMIVTLEEGSILPKDLAADRILHSLEATDRRLLELARDGYRGTANDQWDTNIHDLTSTARRLADRIAKA